RVAPCVRGRARTCRASINGRRRSRDETSPPRARGQYAGSSPRTKYRCATADGARSLGDWCSSALAERRLRSSGASSGPLAISSALRICQHTYALNGAPSCDALASLGSSRPKGGLASPTYGIERIVGEPCLSRVRMLRFHMQVRNAGRTWLRNRDPRLAKPLDDGVVQVAADRQGLFHIGNNATQLEFQRAVPEAQPEAQQECPGGRSCTIWG